MESKKKIKKGWVQFIGIIVIIFATKFIINNEDYGVIIIALLTLIWWEVSYEKEKDSKI